MYSWNFLKEKSNEMEQQCDTCTDVHLFSSIHLLTVQKLDRARWLNLIAVQKKKTNTKNTSINHIPFMKPSAYVWNVSQLTSSELHASVPCSLPPTSSVSAAADCDSLSVLRHYYSSASFCLVSFPGLWNVVKYT